MNKSTLSKKDLEWLNNMINRLVDLDEPVDYLLAVKRCKEEDSQDYYIGLYEGITLAAKALGKSLYGDTEELIRLIDDTENENVRHWEDYEPDVD